MRSRRTMDFTTGSVSKKLVVFAFPLILTNLLQHLYTAADSAVVGRFAGKTALAAVGATTTATGLVTNLLIGLAAGANIINANLLGANKQNDLRKSMHTGICMGAVFGVLFALIGILISRPFLLLLNCPEDVINDSVKYMRIIFCGIPGSITYNFGAGILRTHGDSKRPMWIISFSGIVNVILNLIFVIIFKMAVIGVALATIISNYLSAFLVLRIIFDPKDSFKLSFSELKMRKHECVNIAKVGIPCGLNAILFNISTAIVTANVNSFGSTVIAASAASTNVTSLLSQIIGAFYTASMTFAGQCFGAGKYKRIDQLALAGTGICVATVSLAAFGITLFPKFFIGLFNTDPQVVEVGSRKLVLMSWSFVVYAASDICLACLRGIKKTTIPTSLNIFCICILRILWVYFVFPLNRESYMLLHWCYPVSYAACAISMVSYYLYCRKKVYLKQPETA